MFRCNNLNKKTLKVNWKKYNVLKLMAQNIQPHSFLKTQNNLNEEKHKFNCKKGLSIVCTLFNKLFSMR